MFILCNEINNGSIFFLPSFFLSFFLSLWRKTLLNQFFHYTSKISSPYVCHEFTMVENENMNATVHPSILKLSTLPILILFPYRKYKCSCLSLIRIPRGKVFCSNYREIPFIESLCNPKFRGTNSDYREKSLFREK